MLNSYFQTQAATTIKNNKRIEKLNQIANKNNTKHENFKTNYAFKNTFFQNINNLYGKTNTRTSAIHPAIQFINYVYQPYFLNIKKTTGFGDFIRGCIYTLEFCEKHGISCDFHIKNHNIKNYLSYFVNKPEVSNTISYYIHKYLGLNTQFTCIANKIDYKIINNSEKDFIHYLNSCPEHNGHIFINTTNFPLHNISPTILNTVTHLLEPTEELNKEIETHINELQLIKKNFITYHIRLGDNFLCNGQQVIDKNHIQYILNKMNINVKHSYFVITDSVLLKQIIISYFPNLRCIFFEISHTCENNDSSIKNTLIEFYIMSYSKAIISFSVYPHGSGFSKWCSVVYNIPYTCYLLPKITYI
jgi:hypothetical protein